METPESSSELEDAANKTDDLRLKATSKSTPLSRMDIKKRSKKKRLLLAIGAVTVLVLAGGELYYTIGTANIPEAAPYHAHLDPEDPCEEFAKITSKCTITFEHSDTVVRDKLISQYPAVGFSWIKPDKIELVYSDGPRISNFPDIIRKDLQEASNELYLLGIEIGEVKRVEKDDFGPNRVISSSIETGSPTKSGSKVILEISTQTVVVPELLDMTKEQSELDLQSLGFDVTFVEEPSTKAPGTVVGQSPEAGEKATKGAKVKVKTAKPEDIKSIKVPAVVGLAEDEANGVLAAAGFTNIAVVKVETSKVTDERVSHVAPGEDRSVRSDSNVVIVISVPEKL